MRIFLSMRITNASGERSISKLKCAKNELRNRMTQSCLNNLNLMNTENEILKTVDFEGTIILQLKNVEDEF